MEWFQNLFYGESVAHSILILALVAASGVLLGSIKVRGIGLGIAGVLFTGLGFGHCGVHINKEVMEFVREFGLILFVYTIGMQVGPGFAASLRKQGLPLNLMAGTVVLTGALLTVAVVYLGGIDMSIAVGLFSGATTNTPALGAAQQALKNLPSFTEELAKNPGLGYAVAYPFGILGIILSMGIIRGVFKVKPAQEAAEFTRQLQSSTPKPNNLNIVVTNPNLDGLPIAKIPGLAASGVVLSRVLKGKDMEVATPETVLRLGDIVHVVGPQEKLREIQIIIGKPSETDLKSMPSHVTTRRVVVTNKRVLGKSIDELDLDAYGVAATRISRADIEFTPSTNFRFQYADTVLLVGEDEAIARAAKELGNSPKHLDHPQIVPIFVGIALGVLVGSIPLHFPNMPAPVKLGLAGGPLIVAILFSRLGRLGPLIYYMPLSANFMLRELGITLFLACVGLKAGDQFVRTLTQGEGLYWMGWAALITVLPILVVGLVARAVYKLNYTSICGLLAGSMTDPPALAFANTMTGSDAPSVSYATVYPMTMLLRVVCAQLLVILFLH
ncbi:MAG: putative transporter [Verrucomicrobia bacterium]|jgi:putative transport protein|nr:putative transporter [Verrucomicrobiota bacterium]